MPMSMMLVGNILKLFQTQLQIICNWLSAMLQVSDKNYVLQLDQDIDVGHPYYATTPCLG